MTQTTKGDKLSTQQYTTILNMMLFLLMINDK